MKVRSDRSPVVEVLRMPSTVEPRSDLGRVESDEPPDLQVGHPSFGDEPADRSARGAAMTSSPFAVAETKQLPESEVALMETSHPGTYLTDQ